MNWPNTVLELILITLLVILIFIFSFLTCVQKFTSTSYSETSDWIKSQPFLELLNLTKIEDYIEVTADCEMLLKSLPAHLSWDNHLILDYCEQRYFQFLSDHTINSEYLHLKW